MAPRSRFRPTLALLVAISILVGGAWLGLPGPAHAQDVAQGLRMYKLKANCAQCHGWAADGDGEFNHEGPSLRKTVLDRDSIIETVRCGRPGTPMPFHARSAYTADAATSCYGITLAEVRAIMPDPGNGFLSQAETEALAEYLMTWVVGRGEITLEECAVYWGEGHRNCARYTN